MALVKSGINILKRINMLTIRLLFLNMLFLFSTMSVYAQLDMHSRMQRHTDSHREAVNRFMSQKRSSMNPFKFKFKGKSHKKYRFFIVMANGDTIDPKEDAKINLYLPVQKLTYKSGKETYIYTPYNTKEIYVKKKSEVIRGVKYSEYSGYWIFKTYSTNDYNFYALYPELDINLVAYYQFGNSPIRMLDAEATEKIISGSEEAKEALRSKGLGKALEIYIKESRQTDLRKINQEFDNAFEP